MSFTNMVVSQRRPGKVFRAALFASEVRGNNDQDARCGVIPLVGWCTSCARRCCIPGRGRNVRSSGGTPSIGRTRARAADRRQCPGCALGRSTVHGSMNTYSRGRCAAAKRGRRPAHGANPATPGSPPRAAPVHRVRAAAAHSPLRGPVRVFPHRHGSRRHGASAPSFRVIGISD